jgi:Ca-activated chloride channel homolog
MRFAQPKIFWLMLVLLPALVLFLVWAWRKKQLLIAQFVRSRLLAHLTVGVSQQRQKIRFILLAFAAALLLVALARPQFGFDWQEAKQQGLDIVVAIDTSRSMLAEDLPPNRLARAKLAALDLMRLAKSDRLALVAFAGSAFLQCPLTLDEEAFRQSINALDTSIIPQGGSALSQAIDAALEAFDKSGDNHKVLVLFTDGEDHESGVLDTAKEAAKKGLKIFTIGVGTAQGEMLRVKDEQGNLGFLKDESGNAVKSRLNEPLLQQIAEATKGFYMPLRGTRPIETVYTQGLAPLPKSDATTKLVKLYREQFRWPVLLAMAALLLEMFLPQRKRVARTEQIATGANPELRKVIALMVLLLLPSIAHGSVTTAKRDYEAGRFEDALQEYHRLMQNRTNDYRLHYNAGDAAYKAKQFDLAEKHFQSALASPDLKLQEQAYYNLGNTLYQRGEPETDLDQKKKAWEQAIRNYENALKLNAQDADAKNNLGFVKKRLEELKKQEQQQKQENKPNDQSKQDDKQKQDQQSSTNKNDQAKQDQQKQKQDQQQKDEQQKQKDQQQQSAKDDQQKKDSGGSKEDQAKQAEKQKQEQEQKKQEEARQAKKGEKSPERKEQGEEGTAAAAVRMTPQQAFQLLDAQKQEEKALIFAPPKKENQNRSIKDW